MDKRVNDIIADVAEELGITEFKVTKVVENTFNYLRNSMTKLECEEYYIPKFGKFNILQKRYEKHLENNKNKAIKKEELNNINNLNKTTN